MNKAAMFVLALAFVPLGTAFAGSGAIWTTSGSCGNPQDLNHYSVGETVYVKGSGFDSGESGSWEIKQPGANGAVIADGSVIAGSDGEFCVEAITLEDEHIGGPYQVNALGKNDNFSVNEGVPETGNITIVKEVDHASGNDIDCAFSSNIPLHDEFVLQGGDSEIMLSQDAGIYVVSEDVQPDGWSFESVTCSGSNDWEANGPSLTIELFGGEDVVCTFVNTFDQVPIPGCTDPQASNFDPEATEDDGSCEYPPAPGTITIVKQVLGDVAEWAFDFVGFGGFSLDTANSSQAFEDLEIGEYSVSETVPEGWAIPDIQCVDTDENQVGQVVDSGVSLTLGEDQGITCTFTNRQEMGTLHVVKDIAGETNATPEMFQFTVNEGTPVTFEADGQNDLVLLAGTYTVEEVTAQGFATSYEGCNEIVIEDGGEATCTITNRVLDGGGEDELSCSLTSSDTSVRRGREVVLSWDVQNATDVAIDSGVGEDLPANGSSAVTVNADTTYVLTASNSETEETIQCSVSVDTRSGGGGGSRRAPSGEVAGDSDESPVPEVAGVQTAVLPVGAPNTGMGGASGNAAAASMLGSFLLMIGGIVATRFTKGA